MVLKNKHSEHVMIFAYGTITPYGCPFQEPSANQITILLALHRIAPITYLPYNTTRCIAAETPISKSQIPNKSIMHKLQMICNFDYCPPSVDPPKAEDLFGVWSLVLGISDATHREV